MNIDPIDIELIERYLDGALDQMELKRFNERLQEDPEFERLVKIRQSLPGLLEKAEQLEKTKQEVSDGIAENKYQILHFIRPAYLAWAAVVIVLIGTAIGYLVLRHSGNDQNISGSNSLQKGDTIIISPGYKQNVKATKKNVISESDSIDSMRESVNEIIFRVNDMIRLNWKYKTDSFTHLYILSAGTDKIVIKTEIKPGTEVYTLEAKKLKAGRYYWFIGNKEIKRFFTVEK